MIPGSRVLAVAAALLAFGCRPGSAARQPGAGKPSAPAKPVGSLCLSQTVGYGQSTVSLLCRGDSCTAVRFAAQNPAPQRIGWFTASITAAQLAQGRALARAVQAKDDWHMMRDMASLYLVLDDSLTRAVTRHPANSEGLRALDDWKDSLLDAAWAHPAWTDSLLAAVSQGNLEVSLASGPANAAWLSGSPSLTLSFLKRSPEAEGDELPNHVEAPDSRAAAVAAGRKCLQKAPKGAHWARAILKASPQAGRIPPTQACLEGRFELVSEWVAIK